MTQSFDVVGYLSNGLRIIRKTSLRSYNLTVYNQAFSIINWDLWARNLCGSTITCNNTTPTTTSEALSEQDLNLWAMKWAAEIVCSRGLKEISDAHPVFKQAVKNLNDNHSQFITPSENEHFHSPQNAPLMPSIELLHNGIGKLTIPEYSRPIEEWGEYVRISHEGIQKLIDAGVSKWIVDLRGNTGGSLPPMLASVAPFTKPETNGAFFHYYYPNEYSGIYDGFRFEGSGFAIGKELIPDIKAPSFKISSYQPLVILADNLTGSAAEGACIALMSRPYCWLVGEPTAGGTTLVADGPEMNLSDGAKLCITSGLMADSKRRGHATPLYPSQGQTIASGYALNYARKWLSLVS